MDTRPNTRPIDRQRKPRSPQAPRGSKQIVIPMTQALYDDVWHDSQSTRRTLAEWAGAAPELFPDGFDQGYLLQGFGRPSRKLAGLKLRKIILTNGQSYWLPDPASSPAT